MQPYVRKRRPWPGHTTRGIPGLASRTGRTVAPFLIAAGGAPHLPSRATTSLSQRPHRERRNALRPHRKKKPHHAVDVAYLCRVRWLCVQIGGRHGNACFPSRHAALHKFFFRKRKKRPLFCGTQALFFPRSCCARLRKARVDPRAAPPPAPTRTLFRQTPRRPKVRARASELFPPSASPSHAPAHCDNGQT